MKGLPGNKIILSEKRSSSLGSTKTTPHHPRASSLASTLDGCGRARRVPRRGRDPPPRRRAQEGGERRTMRTHATRSRRSTAPPWTRRSGVPSSSSASSCLLGASSTSTARSSTKVPIVPELDFPRTRCWPTSARRTTSSAIRIPLTCSVLEVHGSREKR